MDVKSTDFLLEKKLKSTVSHCSKSTHVFKLTYSHVCAYVQIQVTRWPINPLWTVAGNTGLMPLFYSHMQKHQFLPCIWPKSSPHAEGIIASVISVVIHLLFQAAAVLYRHSFSVVRTFSLFTVHHLSHEMEHTIPVSWRTYQYPLSRRSYPSHGSVVCFLWRVPES